jgi:cardiolipin synthase
MIESAGTAASLLEALALPACLRRVDYRANRHIRASPPRWIILIAVCAGLVGCASVPDIDRSVGQPSAAASKPQIVGAQGPLSAKQSKALLDRISTEPGDAGVLKRHLAIEQAVAESPLVAGNRTQILRDGAEIFPAMFDAIRGAKDHINLEYYIFEDVESGGQKLGDLLIAKRREGVAVNVIYDSYGSDSTPSAFFDRLKQAGVKFVDFNPIDPLSAKNGYAPNDRDHRKILIVDGATAIVGGVNLSTTYQRSGIGKSQGPKGEPSETWHDIDLEIQGPVVAQLQTLFLDHWTAQKDAPPDGANFFPKVPPKGNEVVRIIGSTPEEQIPRYYVTLLSAIRSAEKRIWVMAAYFVPTHQEMEDLTDAARRGVDVRLLVPDHSDSPTSLSVQHASYSDLLEAGVKIYETQNEVLHSKMVTVDGAWSVIGSSNFDHRSVIFNDEVDAVVLGNDTGNELAAMFEEEQRNARAIDLATWEDRPFDERLDETFSRILENLL